MRDLGVASGWTDDGYHTSHGSESQSNRFRGSSGAECEYNITGELVAEFSL